MNEWLVFAATLPTTPSALRVRVWRGLKATGAGALREGVYILPSVAPTADALWAIQRNVVEAGAQAHMLLVTARDDSQEHAFRALFDRSDRCLELLTSIKALNGTISKLNEAELRSGLHALEQQLQTVRAIDFFPGATSQKVANAMDELRRKVELHLSPSEPSPTALLIERLVPAHFQGRTWATRKRPWVDRLATAWLIQTFIDKSPRFVWLDDLKSCPPDALGFDFDGARFTHSEDKVTFEVVAASFSIAEPGISALGQLVHCIDVGGVLADEAPGLELLVRGLQAQHATDDALLSAALPLFDTLFAALQPRL